MLADRQFHSLAPNVINSSSALRRSIAVGRVSRGGKWCRRWEPSGSRCSVEGRLKLVSAFTGTRRSSFPSRVTLDQAIHHFSKGKDLGV